MCTKCKHQQSPVASKPLFVTHNDTEIKLPDHLTLQGYVVMSADKLQAKFGDIKPGLLTWEILFDDGTVAMLQGSATSSDVEIFGSNYRAVELVKKVLFGG
jgi:hypothetical protein